MRYIRHYRVLP